jgi:hypothetical protein
MNAMGSVNISEAQAQRTDRDALQIGTALVSAAKLPETMLCAHHFTSC